MDCDWQKTIQFYSWCDEPEQDWLEPVFAKVRLHINNEALAATGAVIRYLVPAMLVVGSAFICPLRTGFQYLST